MKELQKYVSRVPQWATKRQVYLCSEADAVFAEIRREHAEELSTQRRWFVEQLNILETRILNMREQHVEEIQRLKTETALPDDGSYIERPPPAGYASWYDAAVAERVKRVAAWYDAAVDERVAVEKARDADFYNLMEDNQKLGAEVLRLQEAELKNHSLIQQLVDRIQELSK